MVNDYFLAIPIYACEGGGFTVYWLRFWLFRRLALLLQNMDKIVLMYKLFLDMTQEDLANCQDEKERIILGRIIRAINYITEVSIPIRQRKLEANEEYYKKSFLSEPLSDCAMIEDYDQLFCILTNIPADARRTAVHDISCTLSWITPMALSGTLSKDGSDAFVQLIEQESMTLGQCKDFNTILTNLAGYYNVLMLQGKAPELDLLTAFENEKYNSMFSLINLFTEDINQDKPADSTKLLTLIEQVAILEARSIEEEFGSPEEDLYQEEQNARIRQLLGEIFAEKPDLKRFHEEAVRKDTAISNADEPTKPTIEPSSFKRLGFPEFLEQYENGYPSREAIVRNLYQKLTAGHYIECHEEDFLFLLNIIEEPSSKEQPRIDCKKDAFRNVSSMKAFWFTLFGQKKGFGQKDESLILKDGETIQMTANKNKINESYYARWESRLNSWMKP